MEPLVDLRWLRYVRHLLETQLLWLPFIVGILIAEHEVLTFSTILFNTVSCFSR